MFALINLSYLAAAVCFILGIKGMTRPKTAVRGNQLAAIGIWNLKVQTHSQMPTRKLQIYSPTHTHILTRSHTHALTYSFTN